MIRWTPGMKPSRQGKVRDLYDLGEKLLIVASDRISAFDWVLPTPIPDKGRVLTGLSVFWFSHLKVPHHLVSTDPADVGIEMSEADREKLRGRIMIARKADVVPFECVVRGYLSGSGWKEYQKSGTVCGQALPAGLVQSDRLPEPIFTPATKAESGHDENVPFARMRKELGGELAEELRMRSIAIYEQGREHAQKSGLILADTKFEWGLERRTGELILVDEVLTPDSSRYWPMSEYRPGGAQVSFDKQYVRDWLESCGWDKSSPPPELPAEVVQKTRAKYIQAYEIITGSPFAWS